MTGIGGGQSVLSFHSAMSVLDRFAIPPRTSASAPCRAEVSSTSAGLIENDARR